MQKKKKVKKKSFVGLASQLITKGNDG
jgi:hypothetical protein